MNNQLEELGDLRFERDSAPIFGRGDDLIRRMELDAIKRGVFHGDAREAAAKDICLNVLRDIWLAESSLDGHEFRELRSSSVSLSRRARSICYD